MKEFTDCLRAWRKCPHALTTVHVRVYLLPDLSQGPRQGLEFQHSHGLQVMQLEPRHISPLPATVSSCNVTI